MKIYTVDAFTNKPFAGNPAAVCILKRTMPDEWMQNIAKEMNLSETAYLIKQANGYSLRWFTPMLEVELCGHATLASSHILWETGILSPDETAIFHTLSGELKATKNNKWITLDFPTEPESKTEIPADIENALRIPIKYIGKNRFDFLVETDSELTVQNMSPDLEKLKQFKERGFIITAKSENTEFDFVSRFFAPSAGINEDPVTGSAHCCLAPYWQKKLGKNSFLAHQISLRGGILKVEVCGERILISGQAVTIMSGEIVT